MQRRISEKDSIYPHQSKGPAFGKPEPVEDQKTPNFVDIVEQFEELQKRIESSRPEMTEVINQKVEKAQKLLKEAARFADLIDAKFHLDVGSMDIQYLGKKTGGYFYSE